MLIVDGPVTPPVSPPHKPKNSAHNIIERRYRNNINDRIAELRNVVPALCHVNSGKRRRIPDEDHGDDELHQREEEYIDGVAIATKLNKATILQKATEYIQYLRKTNDSLQEENDTLQAYLKRIPGGEPALARYHAQKLHRIQQQPHKTMSTSNSMSPSNSSSSLRTTTTFMALFLCMSFSLPEATDVPATASSDGLSVLRLVLLVIMGLLLVWPAHKKNKSNKDQNEDLLPNSCLHWHASLQVLRLIIRRTLHVDIHSGPQDPSWLEPWLQFDGDDILSQVYACARLINLAETVGCQGHIDLVVVYATVAMRLDRFVSRRLAQVYWNNAMFEMTDDHPLRSLAFDVHHPDDDTIAMLDSEAWAEALAHHPATLDHLAHLHLLDNLRTEFARLIISITSPPPSSTTHPFNPILVAAPADSNPRWLAAVGVAVEALWRHDNAAAEDALGIIIEASERSTLGHKMVSVLQGTAALIRNDRKQAIAHLLDADATQLYMKRVVKRRRVVGLESQVLALAEFVVSMQGLQAWIDVWRTETWAASHVKSATLALRRMMRCSSLERLPAHHILVDRLSRLGYFVARPIDEEEDDDDVEDNEESPADRAMGILRGFV
ncbi:helix-loop-helix DNA-binding domain-containing protein [Dichotomocladium elegans]|nr:helix-loop-helix DNA-binding domain-containing protein [Dichotomocladium elegans]